MKRNLVQIIRDNPGCIAVIDNDAWNLYRKDPFDNPHDEDSKPYEAWEMENELACSADEFDPPLGDGGYGSDNCYGGDILQALAKIVGITVKSV